MQDSGSLAVLKVTARDQGHYKGPSGAFVTYCNISYFIYQLYQEAPFSFQSANTKMKFIGCHILIWNNPVTLIFQFHQ